MVVTSAAATNSLRGHIPFTTARRAPTRFDGALSRAGDRSGKRGRNRTPTRRHSVPTTKTTRAKVSAGPRAKLSKSMVQFSLLSRLSYSSTLPVLLRFSHIGDDGRD